MAFKCGNCHFETVEGLGRYSWDLRVISRWLSTRLLYWIHMLMWYLNVLSAKRYFPAKLVVFGVFIWEFGRYTSRSRSLCLPDWCAKQSTFHARMARGHGMWSVKWLPRRTPFFATNMSWTTKVGMIFHIQTISSIIMKYKTNILFFLAKIFWVDTSWINDLHPKVVDFPRNKWSMNFNDESSDPFQGFTPGMLRECWVWYRLNVKQEPWYQR